MSGQSIANVGEEQGAKHCLELCAKTSISEADGQDPSPPATHSDSRVTRARLRFSSTHPSRDVIFFGQISAKKARNFSSVHDVWEPLKQALLASRDVIISGQSCISRCQRFFTLGDGCWLPIDGRKREF